MESQFYTFEDAVNTSETGSAYPAAVPFSDADYFKPTSLNNLKHGQFADFVPDCRYKLARNAKLCDMMSGPGSTATMRLISQKLYDFIHTKANLPDHRYYDVTIETKTGIMKYYYLHLENPRLIDYVDFENTVFYKKKYSDNLGFLDINSHQEYLMAKEELGTKYFIGVDKMVLLKSIPYDIFYFPLTFSIVISANFAEQLKGQNFTGIEMNPYNLTF